MKTDIQAEKLSIIQQLLNVDGELLLEAAQKLLDYGLKKGARSEEQLKDFWDELTEAQKAQIELSRKQLREGKGLPHEEVMEAFRKKYKLSVR